MPLVNGTGNSTSPGRPTPGVVKQDKSSGGSVDTTKTRSGPQRVTMSSGERPIGAANGKQSDTKASCQPPAPPPPPGTRPCCWHLRCAVAPPPPRRNSGLCHVCTGGNSSTPPPPGTWPMSLMESILQTPWSAED